MISADLDIALRAMAALIFVSAALGKMRHWAAFDGVVANYRLLPDALVTPVARGLPPVEAAIGISLLTPWASPWAGAAAASLLLLFAGAMAINLLRGRRHIDCGCFQSTLKQTLRWPLVGRNVVMAFLVGWGALAADRASTPDPWSVLTGLLGGAALFIVWQSLNTLWSIVPAFARETP